MKGVRGTGCKQTGRMGQLARAKPARQLLSWRANFAVGARHVPSWRANFDLASKKFGFDPQKPTYCNISTKQRNQQL